MADNITAKANTGSGTEVLAADDIGPGVLYPRVKITLGADGVNNGDVASGNPMPISGTVTANAGTGTFTVSGTVSATQSGTWNVRAQDGAGNALASSTTTPAGTEQALIVRNIPSGTQAVSGTFWQATQPVSGTVTANAGTGNFNVIGPGASGAAVSGNPVRVAGSDGTNTRNILTDSSGNQTVVGPGAAGSAISGNPVRIAGSDGTNTRNVLTDSSGNLLVANVAGTAAIGSVGPTNVAVTDIASAAITSTTTTAAITPVHAGGTASFAIFVTAVSGTTPTMDVVIQESEDAGTTWVDVWHFPRITATGNYRTPLITFKSNRIRYVQTISGTTPSFTRSIVRTPQPFMAEPERYQFINRTVSLTTLNSNTGAFEVQGCDTYEALLWITTVGTSCTVQLQGSDDNVNWFGMTSSTALTAGVTRLSAPTANGYSFRYIRVVVTAAGTGSVLDHVVLKGWKA